MKKVFIFWFVLVWLPFLAVAQAGTYPCTKKHTPDPQKSTAHKGWLCTYFMFEGMSERQPEVLGCLRSPTNKNAVIDYAIADILYLIGLKPDLKVLDYRGIGENCGAIFQDSVSYIVVNDRFFGKITGHFTQVMPMFIILAHELAHHFNADTRRAGAGVPGELNADYFAGTILKKMGLTEKEVDSTLTFLDQYQHGGTHPELDDRKEAIKCGWVHTSRGDDPNEIREKLKAIYDEVLPFRNGFAIVRKNGHFGYINALGREVIAAQFDEAKPFADTGLARVRQDGNWYLIDPYGRKQAP